jgi:hypothetical protein
VDTSLAQTPLKVFGTITRPGLKAGMVAAFNVNNTGESVFGALHGGDVPGLVRTGSAQVAVYRYKAGSVALLNTGPDHVSMVVNLPPSGAELYTLVPVSDGEATFGLLNKYLGPAAVVNQARAGSTVVVRLAEAGDFGAWLEHPPDHVDIDGKTLAAGSFDYTTNLLRIPRSSFGAATGEHEVHIALAR